MNARNNFAANCWADCSNFFEGGRASLGAGVPHMAYVSQRGPTELLPFYEELGEEGVKAYWARKNRLSIDGKETGIQGEHL